MKTVTKLAKDLDFTAPYEYYEYMVESYINGNFSQCKHLFQALTKEDKKDSLVYIKTTYNMSANNIDREVYDYYFNLL